MGSKKGGELEAARSDSTARLSLTILSIKKSENTQHKRRLIATHIPFKYVRRVKITLAYFTVTVIGLLRAYLCTSMSTQFTRRSLFLHPFSFYSWVWCGFDAVVGTVVVGTAVVGTAAVGIAACPPPQFARWRNRIICCRLSPFTGKPTTSVLQLCFLPFSFSRGNLRGPWADLHQSFQHDVYLLLF